MSRSLLLAPLAFTFVPLMLAQPGQPASPPPPVAQASPRVTTPMTQPGQPAQRVYGPIGDTLIARQTADGILEGFR